MDKQHRQRYLNGTYAKKILEVFSNGIPEEDAGIIENKISCAEAIAVLEHTMEVIQGEVPLDFNFQKK